MLLVLAWGFALVGSIVKVGRIDRLDEDSPLPYLVMGSMVAGRRPGGSPRRVPPGEFLWLLAGGAAYAIGLIFFIATTGASITRSGTSSSWRAASATTGR